MLLYIILFSVVLRSITCDMPSFIHKCRKPDPNAGNCFLNSARYAMPFLLNGIPELNLYDYTMLPVHGLSLILEYNFERNNTKIELDGLIFPSDDTYLYEASINLNFPSLHFLIGGSLVTSDFDFVLNIYDESRTIQAKGHIFVTQDNWRVEYNSDFIIKEFDNVKHMQIGWSYGYLTDDTFDISYTGISTLDDQPLTDVEMIRVKKALRNFEDAYHVQQSQIGEGGITPALNTIFKLEPEDEIFLPPLNPCSEVDYE